MTQRESFTTADGAIGGWVTGEGTPVLLAHGGPGLDFDYLGALADELGHGFRVAAFQQRGLAPSSSEGPFTMTQALADVTAVLAALDWSEAVLVGHSWGGHLALRFAAAHPERLLGVLAVDPLGIAGDGGEAAFEAEMAARRCAGPCSACSPPTEPARPSGGRAQGRLVRRADQAAASVPSLSVCGSGSVRLRRGARLGLASAAGRSPLSVCAAARFALEASGPPASGSASVPPASGSAAVLVAGRRVR
jgi:pimeloyl-ACP methyl ester carboxylesterase